ncbi:MAG: hypothetical protein R3D84_01885 [Paracoccaceae bacterium]
MNDASVLRIYLARPMLDNARAGEVNILNRITAAFSARGYRTEFVQDSEAERLRALGRRGYALYHMHEPLTANTLCLRLSYLYPFWRIEDTNDRWDWDIAKATFDPETVDAGLANTFFDRRRHMLFKATLRSIRTSFSWPCRDACCSTAAFSR